MGKRRPAVGKSPTNRDTRAVLLHYVRKLFTDAELNSMGDAAREALSAVRLTKLGGLLESIPEVYKIGVTGVTYTIPAIEECLQDFLWRLGETETKKASA